MSVRPRKAVLERVPVAVDALPSLALLFHKTADIAGTGKRKIDGSYAATTDTRVVFSKSDRMEARGRSYCFVFEVSDRLLFTINYKFN